MSIFSKINSKIYILYAIIVFIFIVLALLFYPLTYIDKSVIYEMNTGLLYRADGKVDPDGFENFISSDSYKKHRFVTTGFNPLYPKVSLVIDYTSYSEIYINYLDRVGLFDWKVAKFINVTIDNYSFDEIINLLNKHDLTETNPDPKNIRVYDAKYKNTPSPQQYSSSSSSEPTAKENHYNLILYIKNGWSEDMKKSVNERWGLNVNTYEEFRSHPKIIQFYGTVEELGI